MATAVSNLQSCISIHLTLIYSPTRASVFSMFFPCKIPMVLTGEFVHQSRGFFSDGDHFLYSFEINVLLNRDIVRKILMLVTLGLRDFYG